MKVEKTKTEKYNLELSRDEAEALMCWIHNTRPADRQKHFCTMDQALLIDDVYAPLQLLLEEG